MNVVCHPHKLSISQTSVFLRFGHGPQPKTNLGFYVIFLGTNVFCHIRHGNSGQMNVVGALGSQLLLDFLVLRSCSKTRSGWRTYCRPIQESKRPAASAATITTNATPVAEATSQYDGWEPPLRRTRSSPWTGGQSTGINNERKIRKRAKREMAILLK